MRNLTDVDNRFDKFAERIWMRAARPSRVSGFTQPRNNPFEAALPHPCAPRHLCIHALCRFQMAVRAAPRRMVRERCRAMTAAPERGAAAGVE
jgi:hypothetical protein